MVTPLQIGSQLVDWTDPQKAVYVLIKLHLSASLFQLMDHLSIDVQRD